MPRHILLTGTGEGSTIPPMFTCPEADQMQAETLSSYRQQVDQLEQQYRAGKREAYSRYLQGLTRAADLRTTRRLEASSERHRGSTE